MAAVPVRGEERCTAPRERRWQDTTETAATSAGVTSRCVVICGPCLERGHSLYECKAPQERVYNPGYWAIHEPELRRAMVEQGVGWGCNSTADPGWRLPAAHEPDCNWEDPEWRLPPVTVDSDMGLTRIRRRSTCLRYSGTMQRMRVWSSTVVFRCLSLRGWCSAW